MAALFFFQAPSWAFLWRRCGSVRGLALSARRSIGPTEHIGCRKRPPARRRRIPPRHARRNRLPLSARPLHEGVSQRRCSDGHRDPCGRAACRWPAPAPDMWRGGEAGGGPDGPGNAAGIRPLYGRNARPAYGAPANFILLPGSRFRRTRVLREVDPPPHQPHGSLLHFLEKPPNVFP